MSMVRPIRIGISKAETREEIAIQRISAFNPLRTHFNGSLAFMYKRDFVKRIKIGVAMASAYFLPLKPWPPHVADWVWRRLGNNLLIRRRRRSGRSEIWMEWRRRRRRRRRRGWEIYSAREPRTSRGENEGQASIRQTRWSDQICIRRIATVAGLK